MKTNKYFLLTLVSVIFYHNFLMGQNLTSKSIFELKHQEQIIMADENRLHLYNSPTGYLLFTERIIETDTFQFAIYNGKELGPYKYIHYPENIVFAQTGHFYFVAEKNNKLFVNVNGVEFGGFDEVNPQGNCCYHLLQTKTGHFAFAFRVLDDWKINVDGKIYNAFEPTDYRFNKFDISLKNNGLFNFISLKDGDVVANINGTESNGLEKVLENYATDDGKLFILYEKNKEFYIKTEKTDYGPYKNIGYRDNHQSFFCLTYEENNKWYANTNGQITGPYDEISSYYGVKVDENNNYWFGYRKNNQWFVSINGKEAGSFDDYSTQVFFHKNLISYYYISKDKLFYLIGNQSFGPYDKPGWTSDPKPVFLDNGTWYFNFKKDGKAYYNINGKEVGAYDEVFGMKIHNKTDYAFGYKKDNGFYFYSKGKSIGPYDELNSWYGIRYMSNGAFLIQAKHGDQTVININGKEIGQWKDVSVYYFDESANYAFVVWNPEMQLMINGKTAPIAEYPAELIVTSKDYYVLFKTWNNNCVLFNDTKFDNAILLQDFSKKNVLLGTPNEVFLNGKIISSEGGFFYVYHDKSNTFNWLSIKNKKIMLNNYQLK